MDKYNADISLRNATYSPKKLLLIHSGALIGFSLVLSVISYLLNYAIQPSVGERSGRSQGDGSLCPLLRAFSQR